MDCDLALISTGLDAFLVPLPLCFCLLTPALPSSSLWFQIPGTCSLPLPLQPLSLRPCPNFHGCSDKNCASGCPYHLKFPIQVCDTQPSEPAHPYNLWLLEKAKTPLTPDEVPSPKINGKRRRVHPISSPYTLSSIKMNIINHLESVQKNGRVSSMFLSTR